MASLIRDLIDRIQRTTNRVDSSYRQRALDALDESLQWYALRLPWEKLQSSETFLSDGTEHMVLPDRVGVICAIADRTNSRMLDRQQHTPRRYPGAWLQRTSGATLEWDEDGLVPTIVPPSTDSTLILETTASEGMQVTVRGLVRDTNASGTALELYEAMETLTMAGTTQPTSNAYVRVLAIQKDDSTETDLKVYESVSGQLLSRIPKWTARPLFRRVRYFYVPTAGTQFEVFYMRRPDRLTTEDDAIDAAVEEEPLIWRAAGNMHWMDNEAQPAQLAWQKADELLVAVQNREEAFGEADYTASPWVGYLNLEGLGDPWGW